MHPVEQQLNKLTEVVAAAGEAVSSAQDTCFTIVAGQLAGMGADCLDKWFLTEERHSTKTAKPKVGSPQPTSLSRKKAEKLAEKLSKHVSVPPDPSHIVQENET